VVKFLLVAATVANGALAALLVGVSGFLFEGGPESIHAGVLADVARFAAVSATCRRFSGADPALY